MSSFYNELKKTSCANTYLQKNDIPVTVKRNFRKRNKRGTFFAEFSGICRDYSKLREKIAKKRSSRLMLRLHYVFTLRLIYAAVFCLTFIFTQYMPAFAGAISVPREARDTVENAKTAAQAVIDEEQAVLDRLNAEEYVEDAVMFVNGTGEKVREAEAIAKQKRQEAEQLQAKAQIATQDAEAATAKAAQDRYEAEKAVYAANSAGRYAQSIEEGAKLRIEDISKAASKKLDELDSSPEDVSEKQLREVADKALSEMGKIQEETSAAITAAYERADRLSEAADRLEAKAEQSELIADKKLEEADLARDMAEQAKDEAANAQEMYDDLLANLREAMGEEQLARNDLASLIREQNNPKGSHYYSAHLNYYSWSDSHGNSGHQFAKPFSYGYSQKEYSYGISVNHINAGNNSAGENGNVSTFTDVTASVDKRKETEKYIYNYGLDVNLPTGKPTLSWSERYAMMTEDLVELGQFGKGWQFTPRFAVSKKFNKENTLTFGTSYSFNGSYDPTSDIPNDSITPGNEWMKKLRWQHAGQEWQFVGELIHTSSSPTKVSNGSSYPVSSSWEQRLTYNRKLNETQDLMFYYWRQNSSSNAVLPTSAKEAAINYLGTMWSKKLNDKRTFRLTFDVMKSNGNHYSHMTNYGTRSNPEYSSVSVDGRTKYTIGAIYDHKLTKDSKITAELQKFTMKDGESTIGTTTKPPTDYDGINFFMSYSKAF